MRPDPAATAAVDGDESIMKISKPRAWVHATLCGLGILAAVSTTGCQVDVGGQTLPSAYYLDDDVQYFPAGPEFKLSREAAAQKAFAAEQELQGGSERGY